MSVFKVAYEGSSYLMADELELLLNEVSVKTLDLPRVSLDEFFTLGNMEHLLNKSRKEVIHYLVKNTSLHAIEIAGAMYIHPVSLMNYLDPPVDEKELDDEYKKYTH